jgi:hypothetical protein
MTLVFVWNVLQQQQQPPHVFARTTDWSKCACTKWNTTAALEKGSLSFMPFHRASGLEPRGCKQKKNKQQRARQHVMTRERWQLLDAAGMDWVRKKRSLHRKEKSWLQQQEP